MKAKLPKKASNFYGSPFPSVPNTIFYLFCNNRHRTTGTTSSYSCRTFRMSQKYGEVLLEHFKHFRNIFTGCKTVSIISFPQLIWLNGSGQFLSFSHCRVSSHKCHKYSVTCCLARRNSDKNPNRKGKSFTYS